MSALSNNEILQHYLDNGLIQKCVDYQFAKIDKEYKEDFFQDLCLIILTYDNVKLNDAHNNNHFNAFLTRVIQNNIFSASSRYWATYKKFESKTEEITKEMENIIKDV